MLEVGVLALETILQDPYLRQGGQQLFLLAFSRDSMRKHLAYELEPRHEVIRVDAGLMQRRKGDHADNAAANAKRDAQMPAQAGPLAIFSLGGRLRREIAWKPLNDLASAQLGKKPFDFRR